MEAATKIQCRDLKRNLELKFRRELKRVLKEASRGTSRRPELIETVLDPLMGRFVSIQRITDEEDALNFREVVVNFEPIDYASKNNFVLIAANQDLMH